MIGSKCFSMVYKNGKGYITFELEKFFPCTKQVFKLLLGAVEMSDNPMANARQLYDYFCTRLDREKEERNKWEGFVGGADLAGGCNVTIKKWLMLINELSDRYGFDKKDDYGATIRMKKTEIYCRKSQRGQADSVESCEGYSFEKNGYLFDAYKADSGWWHILCHGTGVMVFCAQSKKSVIPSVNIGKFEDCMKGEEFMDYVLTYNYLMVEAGYWTKDDAEKNKKYWNAKRSALKNIAA